MSALRLATIFAACGPEGRVDSGIEQTLGDMLQRSRAAWPGIAVDDGEYVRFVASRAPGGQASRIAELHATDLYLTCACGLGDAKAIAALDRQFLGELLTQLAKGGVQRAVADEAVQALRSRLFVADGRPAKIAEYSGRGPLGGWLRVAATRLALNVRRDEAARANVGKGKGAGPPDTLPGIDPEIATIQRRYGDEFNRAFRQAFGSLTPEERSVLRLHFADGLNLERIAGALGLSRATVGRRMITARERLLAETLRLLGESLRATPTELESLLAVVRSKLEVSLAALIAPVATDDG